MGEPWYPHIYAILAAQSRGQIFSVQVFDGIPLGHLRAGSGRKSGRKSRLSQRRCGTPVLRRSPVTPEGTRDVSSWNLREFWVQLLPRKFLPVFRLGSDLSRRR